MYPSSIYPPIKSTYHLFIIVFTHCPSIYLPRLFILLIYCPVICSSIHQSIYFSISSPIYQSSTHLLSTHLTIHGCIHLPIQSTCLPIYLSIYYSSVYQLIKLSISYLSIQFLVTFPVAVIKYSDKRKLRENVFTLAHSSYVMEKRSRQQELEHLVPPSIRKQKA